MAIVRYRVSSIFNWTIIDISLGRHSAISGSANLLKAPKLRSLFPRCWPRWEGRGGKWGGGEDKFFSGAQLFSPDQRIKMQYRKIYAFTQSGKIK